MIFNIPKDLKFSNYYKKLNLVSLIFVIFSVLIILFKGLNFGVDFKGGTLIEIRTEIQKPDIAEIRKSLLKMKLDNVTVKKFGQENDFLIKIDTKNSLDENFIATVNNQLIKDLGYDVNFRRVENVGPKVSKELLRDGLIAITLSLAAMLRS